MGLTANTGPYNAAAEHYGVDDTIMSKIPRKKFQFSVEITIHESIPLIDESYGRSFTFHRVQGVNLPDYDFNTITVNQYNRQRYVHTRIQPTAAGITFYDTVDNQFQNLLKAYTQHYSQGNSISQQTMATYDTITPGFDGTYGIKPVSTNERYFFPQISILSRDTANSARSITMYNCMISSVQHDRLDYSDSSPVLWQVQFQPEQVNLDSANSSNGATGAGAGAPTTAYDISKSRAAGVLVNNAGELIKDAAGNAIKLSSVLNFGATSTSDIARFAVDAAGNALRDALGNPLVVGTIAANPTVGAIAQQAVSSLTNNNNAANISNAVNAVNTFKNNGFAAGFNRVISNLFG